MATSVPASQRRFLIYGALVGIAGILVLAWQSPHIVWSHVFATKATLLPVGILLAVVYGAEGSPLPSKVECGKSVWPVLPRSRKR